MARFSFLAPHDGVHSGRGRGHAAAVLGLGRFGEAVALELMAEGAEVLGVDNNPSVIQRLDGQLTVVATADVTDAEVLNQLSVPELDRVVLGISSDIAASILTASQLIRSNVEQIWAAAATDQHGLILEQIGVHHVVYPEQDMGKRVAHLVRGSLLEYIRVGDDFAVAETVPPASVTGAPLDPARIEALYGVRVIARRTGTGPWEFTGAGSVISAQDRILVAGPPDMTDAFSQLT